MAATAHQCLRNFISLPEKKSSVPALANLGQAVVNSTLTFIITRILAFKDNKDDINATALASLNEDTMTVLTLLTGVQEEQSRLKKHHDYNSIFTDLFSLYI